MVRHIPTLTSRTPLEQYQAEAERTLDAYKLGNISETEALAHAERAAALLVDTLRSNFLVRLRNLEPFRTSRGEHYVSKVAE